MTCGEPRTTCGAPLETKSMEIHNKLEERFYNETFANPTDVRKLGFRVSNDTFANPTDVRK